MNWKKHGFMIAILIAAVVHLSYLNNGWTWLDHNDVEQGRAVLPLANVGGAFLVPFGNTQFYRPLVVVVNSIDAAVFGEWAPGWHATSVLLQLAVVAASGLFALTWWNLSREEIVWLMLVMAVHPLSSLIVGAVPYRQESMLLVFLMLAVYGYAKARRDGDRKYTLLALGALGAGLLTKETTVVVVPTLIVLWEALYSQTSKQWKRLWVMEVSLIVLYVVARMLIVPKIWGTEGVQLTLEKAIGTRILLVGRFLGDLVSPLRPGLSDAVHVVGLGDMRVIALMVGLAAAGLGIVRYGIQSDLGKVIAVTTLLLLPGLNIVPVPRIGSPHYPYLAVVGVAAAAVLLTRRRRWWRWVLSAWLILAAGTSFMAGVQFKNDEALFVREVARDANFLEAYYYLGNYYRMQGDMDKAKSEYEMGLRKPADILAFQDELSLKISLAGVLVETGKLDEADALYEDALTRAGDNVKPYLVFNQALIAQQKGNDERVVELLAGRTWERPEPFLLLAQSYHALEKRTEEVDALEQALPFLQGQLRKNVEQAISGESAEQAR